MKKEGGQNAFAFCHTLFFLPSVIDILEIRLDIEAWFPHIPCYQNQSIAAFDFLAFIEIIRFIHQKISFYSYAGCRKHPMHGPGPVMYVIFERSVQERFYEFYVTQLIVCSAAHHFQFVYIELLRRCLFHGWHLPFPIAT